MHADTDTGAVTARALAMCEAARARADAATPGPWRWSVHFNSKHVDLVGRATVYVMGFVRWGMGGAAPTFRTHDKPGDCGFMERADVFMEIDPQRPHHADWHRLLIHPDAAFIAHARADVPLLATIAAAAVRLTMRDGDADYPWWYLSDECVGCLRGSSGLAEWGDFVHGPNCPAAALDAAIRAAGELAP